MTPVDWHRLPQPGPSSAPHTVVGESHRLPGAEGAEGNDGERGSAALVATRRLLGVGEPAIQVLAADLAVEVPAGAVGLGHGVERRRPTSEQR